MEAKSGKRHSRSEWEQLIATYEQDNLIQREFCAQKGLAYSTFCYWRKQLRESSSANPATAPLIELPRLTSDEPVRWCIELDLGQGVVLRIR